VTLRLPKELHEKLKAEAGPRGFAAEVRQRLEASLGGSFPNSVPHAPALREVLRAIDEAALFSAGLADGAGGDYAAFEAGVVPLLEVLRPHGRLPEEPWTGLGPAGNALSSIGRNDLFARLVEIIKRRQEEAQK
jgi:hypothetical protein